MEHWIVKNTERYGKDLDRLMPSRISCDGTIEQARELAQRLSNWNAGCDYAYYVVGDGENG